MTRQRMARGPMPINGPVILKSAMERLWESVRDKSEYSNSPEIRAWNEAVDRRKAAKKGEK